jgi:probable phosphoglycerate mutase
MLACHGEVIGSVGPTMAEYRALLAGLRRARQLEVRRVDARSDCRVAIAHLRGEQIPNSPALAAVAAEIRDVAAQIGEVRFTWVPSAANAAAHGLVAKALSEEDDPGL